MLVDLWFDFHCPWCYIAETILYQQLLQQPEDERPIIRFHTYLLHPELGEASGQSFYEQVRRSHDLKDLDEAKAMMKDVLEAGQAVGLNFDFERLIHSSSRQAHRILKHLQIRLCAQMGAREASWKLLEYIHAVYRAYFEEGRDIQKRQTLGSILTQVLIQEDAASMSSADDQDLDALISLETELIEAAGLEYIPHFLREDGQRLEGKVSAEKLKVFLGA